MVEFLHRGGEGNAITCTLTAAFCDPTDPINVAEMLAKAFPFPRRAECLLPPQTTFQADI